MFDTKELSHDDGFNNFVTLKLKKVEVVWLGWFPLMLPTFWDSEETLFLCHIFNLRLHKMAFHESENMSMSKSRRNIGK